jgi:hypothetical protein
VRDALKWLTVVAFAVTLVACNDAEKTSTTEESANSPEASKDSALTKAVAKVIPVYRDVMIPAGTTLRLDLRRASRRTPARWRMRSAPRCGKRWSSSQDRRSDGSLTGRRGDRRRRLRTRERAGANRVSLQLADGWR